MVWAVYLMELLILWIGKLEIYEFRKKINREE